MDAANANTIDKKPLKSRGGRPVKAIKRKITLTLKCTAQEAIYIKTQAKQEELLYLNTCGRL